jgi:hypothetical protein
MAPSTQLGVSGQVTHGVLGNTLLFGFQAGPPVTAMSEQEMCHPPSFIGIKLLQQLDPIKCWGAGGLGGNRRRIRRPAQASFHPVFFLAR